MEPNLELIQAEIANLSEILHLHQKKYYEEDQPVISDAEYDKMFQRLQKLETEYPQYKFPGTPTESIGGRLSAVFKSVKHLRPMLSIRTITDTAKTAITDFMARVTETLRVEYVKYTLELKYDGLAISLLYHDGVLVKSLTRGDGESGELVTHNVELVPSVPTKLPADLFPGIFEVRGEMLFPKAAFQEKNKQRREEGKKEYINERAAAAGMIRQNSLSVDDASLLVFYPYQCFAYQSDANLPDSQFERLAMLRSVGFKTLYDYLIGIATDYENIAKYYDAIESIRTRLDFGIDGVVYKVDSIALQEKLGYLSREPRWAIAHKFAPEEMTTTLNAIDIQIGRTGKVTPVARVTPVFVGGVTVSNITMHNLSEIKEKDLRVGDKILVRRAGDVVPEIVSSISRDPDNTAPFTMPSHCPSCNSPIVPVPDSVEYVCSGHLICPEQKKFRMLHFVSRKMVYIDGIGEKLVEQLTEQGYLQSVTDYFCLGLRDVADKTSVLLAELLASSTSEFIYQTALETLTSCGRVGQKTAKNILVNIEKAKQTKLSNLIYGLGIPNVGDNTSKTLARTYGSLGKLSEATVAHLQSLPDIGPTTANSVKDYFDNPIVKEELVIFKILGIDPTEVSNVSVGPFTGLTIVITGSFSKKREDMEYTLRSLGASIGSAVNAKTSILIAGINPRSKYQQALKLGVPVLTEDDYLTAIAYPPTWDKFKQ